MEQREMRRSRASLSLLVRGLARYWLQNNKKCVVFIIGVCMAWYMASYQTGRGEANGAKRNETEPSYFLITIFFLLAAPPPPPAVLVFVFVIATAAASAAAAHFRYSVSNSSKSLVHNV